MWGTLQGTSDQLLAGQGFPAREVEAWYGSQDGDATLYTHFSNPDRRDTLKFFRDSKGWHWVEAKNWGADIFRTEDSLYISFGWGYGGESFYLRRVP